MSKLEELEKKLCTLRDEFNEYKTQLKEAEQEPWPKVGDYYYFVLGGDGNVISSKFGNDTEVDEFRISTNNCHRTKEQALRHKEYITSPRVRARELVEMCEGFDIHGLGVIALEFDGTPKAYEYEDRQPNGGFRFTDFDIAASALISLGEPLIKVAFGVIVDEVEAERIVRLAVSQKNSLSGNEYVGRGE